MKYRGWKPPVRRQALIRINIAAPDTEATGRGGPASRGPPQPPDQQSPVMCTGFSPGVGRLAVGEKDLGAHHVCVALLRGPQQTGKAVAIRQRVGVQQEQEVAARLVGRQRHATREAEVRSRSQNPDRVVESLVPGSRLGTRVVVDEPQLVRPRGLRNESGNRLTRGGRIVIGHNHG